MPFHPGILLSSLVLVTCLGMNMALYPEVRQMLGGQKDTASSTAAPRTDRSSVEKSPYPRLERSKTPVIPEKVEKKPTTVQKPSNVVRPIPPPSKPVLEEKPKKAEAVLVTKSEPAPKPEAKKSEAPPKEEPKKEEPKKAEPKAEEKKTEPTGSNSEKAVTKKKDEPSPALPVEVKSPPKPEPVEKSGASAFLPLVPPELEEEYRESRGKRINQAKLPPPRTLPLLQREPLIPEPAAPVYANPFQPPSQGDAAPCPDPTAPVKRLPDIEPSAPASSSVGMPLPATEVRPPARTAPTEVWDTVDTILERPILYD